MRAALQTALSLRQGLLAVALFDGTCGLRLISCLLEGEEIIAASAARPLIGPHAGLRIPELFQGGGDPAPNGAAHATPWTVVQEEKRTTATLSAEPDSPLAALEGQPFSLRVETAFERGDLLVTSSHTSETDSVIGIPFAFAVPRRNGTVEARVRKGDRRDDQGWIRHPCHLPIEADFSPYPSPLEGSIRLETERYTLLIDYSSHCEENSWRLVVPTQGEWIEITLFTASNPQKPILSCNRLEMRISLTG
jgi:hypothetical protein